MEADTEKSDAITAIGVAAPQPEYVWFWRRASARLIDIAYYYALSFVVGFIVVVLLVVLDQIRGTSYVQSLQNRPSITLAGFLIGTVAMTLYHTILEGFHGSTVGKLICGITVLDSRLLPCGLLAALLRSLAFLVDGLVLGGVAAMSMQSSDMNQRLGDRWAKTVVVRRRTVPRECLRSPIVFIASFVLASVVVSASIAATLLLRIS